MGQRLLRVWTWLCRQRVHLRAGVRAWTWPGSLGGLVLLGGLLAQGQMPLPTEIHLSIPRSGPSLSDPESDLSAGPREDLDGARILMPAPLVGPLLSPT